MGPIIRAMSFFEQWAAEVLRQPALMFTLVVAPFLLLFAFGDSVELGGPRPRTIIVQPADSQQPIAPLLENVDHQVEIVGVTHDLEGAERALERGEVDAVAVLPAEPSAFIEAGQQIPLRVMVREVDPVRRSYAYSYLNDQVAELNQRTIAAALADAQQNAAEVSSVTMQARDYVGSMRGGNVPPETARQQTSELKQAVDALEQNVRQLAGTSEQVAFFMPGLAAAAEQTSALHQSVLSLQQTLDRIDGRAGGAQGGSNSAPAETDLRDIEGQIVSLDQAAGELTGIHPDVFSAPFYLVFEDTGPLPPSFTNYYSPGVLALLVQHLAITLAALTMSRMRLLRVTDVLQVAPIRTAEIVIGNYWSYALLCGLAGAGLLGMLVLILGVPVFGSYWIVALTIGLLIACSLGIGFVISLISSSVQQATQFAMLLLLGSIFFSGFAFALDQMQMPAEGISYFLPATYAIRTLQDVMLRGFLNTPLDLVVLGVASIVFFALTVWLLRRELRPV